MIDTILELAKFNYLKYFDEPHKYYNDKGEEYVSATTFIKKFKKEFQTQLMAEQYASKRGLNVKDVIADWDLKRDVSTVKGTLVHNMAENWWNNKSFPYDPKVAVNAFGLDIIKEKYDKCELLFKKFWADSSPNLIPVKMELVVGDNDYKIAGMVDCLFYNKKSEKLEIWDYKTNKEIKTSNNYGNKMLQPISHLDECELNTYSLQLSLYKHIIEKNTNLEIGNCYLIWIHENNDNYKVIKCNDLHAEIKLMIEHYENTKKKKG
jgi:ATP-dependent exoDNAse (exonuclease V) beta subunit